MLFCYNLSWRFCRGGGFGCTWYCWWCSCWRSWCAAMSISSVVISSASCISRATKSGSQYLPRPCWASTCATIQKLIKKFISRFSSEQTRPTRLSAEPITSNELGRPPWGLDGVEWAMRWLIPFFSVLTVKQIRIRVWVIILNSYSDFIYIYTKSD